MVTRAMSAKPRDDEEDDGGDEIEGDFGRPDGRSRTQRRAPQGRGDRPVEDLPLGTVTRVDARLCRVALDGGVIDCRVRGSLYLGRGAESRPVAVGDRVRVKHGQTPPAVITAVEPRRNVLSRPHADGKHVQIIAANLDQAVLVMSWAQPTMNLRLLDRMIVACEHQGFGVVVVLNKVDLAEQEADVREVLAIYSGIGYPAYAASALTGRGLDELRAVLRDRVSVFAGMSGVGKSALVTAVQPELALKSGEVSQTTGKGKHTTSAASLLPLSQGGFVVDTPGVREFGFSEVAPESLGLYFVEFAPYRSSCSRRGCTHDHETGCAVQAAVEAGGIHPHRYDSYLRILETLRTGD
jgi:ribosome biogenesis GTPase / thiamine phosphate phosphatase